MIDVAVLLDGLVILEIITAFASLVIIATIVALVIMKRKQKKMNGIIGG